MEHIRPQILYARLYSHEYNLLTVRKHNICIQLLVLTHRAEEAPHRNSPPNLAKLGTIQISVLRCVELNKVPWKKSQVHDFNSIGPVHERAKKAGVHCVSCVHGSIEGMIY